MMTPADIDQPYNYRPRESREPDWRRFPAWAEVPPEDWESAQWQRTNCIKSPKQLQAVFGGLLGESFMSDLVLDQKRYATMSMLLPPQMLNTMVPDQQPAATEYSDRFYLDPVRRYMLPVFSDRDADWPSHPHATRDPLHEAAMQPVEGLTWRYPTKVLAELVTTCPQYCGHCTRMDLVGNPTAQVEKASFKLRAGDRRKGILAFLSHNPQIRDVVVSGGDVANVPWMQLESFLNDLLDITSVRGVRLASKSLIGLPQHWLQPKVLVGMRRLCDKARLRGVDIDIHTHANNAQSVTPLVAKASAALLDCGVNNIRNQGVMLRGVNNTYRDILDLSFALLDAARITPYYFYMCDMILNSEHWRTAVWEAQLIQRSIMGYLPGFATPRIVCDVPGIGKCWVDQVERYDRTRGVSYWVKNYQTSLDGDSSDNAGGFRFYDPISTLPTEGQDYWCQHASNSGNAQEIPGDEQ